LFSVEEFMDNLKKTLDPIAEQITAFLNPPRESS